MSVDSFYYQNRDDMEIGDTGFVSREDGWMENKYNGYVRDPEGRIYDTHGDLVFDPDDFEEDYLDEEEEYEWYH